MPIILSPLPDQPFGIGMTGTVDGQAFEVPEDTWKVDFTIRDVPETGRIIGFGSSQGLHHPFSEITIGRALVSGAPTVLLQPYPQFPSTPHGSTVFLTSTVVGSISGLVQTETISVKYDLLTGLQSIIPAQGTATGGFNASDRLNLNSVLSSVQMVAPPALTGGANIVAGIIDFVRGPPRSFLRRFGQQLLTGRGTLSAQPPGALHSFGGTWSFITVPAGYGKDDGALVEWHRRLLQLVVVRDEATSDTYIDVLEDSHYEGNFILWQFPNPLQIQYDVAPGVTVLWQWLV